MERAGNNGLEMKIGKTAFVVVGAVGLYAKVV